jgi:hypothetical protein
MRFVPFLRNSNMNYHYFFTVTHIKLHYNIAVVLQLLEVREFVSQNNISAELLMLDLINVYFGSVLNSITCFLSIFTTLQSAY